MSKRKNKAFRRLDQRIKAWEITCKSVKNVTAYRKPGSMKK